MGYYSIHNDLNQASFDPAKTYAIFRFHWEGLGADAVKGRILEIIGQTSGYILKRTTWNLGDIRTVEVAGGVTIVTARLGAIRSKPEFDFDVERKTFVPIVDEPRANNLLEVLIIEQLNCVLVESRRIPSPKSQLLYIKKMIEGTDAIGAANFTYDPIVEEEEFLSRVRELDFINKYYVTLRPSNPRYRNIWKLVDEQLKEAKIKKLRKTATAVEGESINVESDMVQSDLTQSVDGYGTATVLGSKDGVSKKVSSNDSQATINIPGEIDEAERFARVYAEVAAIATLNS